MEKIKKAEIKKIGLVVMFNLSSGGGGPHVVIDLINALHDLGKEVYLLTPFHLNHKKIGEFYGPFTLEKTFYPGKIKKYLCRESTTSRMLMKKEFQQMAEEVDIVIDIDGGIVHNYLSENKKYIVWRISCIYSELEKFPWAMKRNWKGRLKDAIKDFFQLRRPQPSLFHNIHAVDKWTEQEMIKFWNMHSARPLLYPEIKVNAFPKRKKKNQIVVLGRIAPNKQVDTSIKVFAQSTRKFQGYKLIIMGGETPGTEYYINNLNILIKELKIEDKVSFVKSPPSEKLKEILAECKVIIDSQEQVSMTMTAIEAMAAECVVLAVKNGGTYTDILDNGKFGFGFKDIEEGGRQLEKILRDLEKGKITKKFITNAKNRSKDFSGKKFRERLKEIIKQQET